MWNKIKNIFSKKEELQGYNFAQEDVIEPKIERVELPTEIESEFVDDETTNITDDINDKLKPMATGLAVGDAIAMLIYEHGHDLISSGNVYNAMADYGAFQSNRTSRSIFKSIESEGIFKELLTLTHSDNLENRIIQYAQILTSNYGYDSLIVESVICEILFGLNLMSENECKSRLQKNIDRDNFEKLLDLSEQEASDIPDASEPLQPYDPKLGYKYPSIDVLPVSNQMRDLDSELEVGKKHIEWVLASHGIIVNRISGYSGPRVSMYEIDIDPRKLSKVTRNEKDILYALSHMGSRILNPIPGKMALGIELPNNDKYELWLRDVVDTPEFTNVQYELPVVLGVDSMGSVIIKDLAKIPHLLICGEMQQGKTSFVRQILASLLIKKTFGEVKFTIIDTGGFDLLRFKRLCGCWMAQSVDDSDNSVIYGINNGWKVIREYIDEIEHRKVLFEDAQVSDIKAYNEKFCNRLLDPNKGHWYMPYLILVCDEIEPLVSSNIKEFESIVSSLISRAANTGIHCIFTTKYTFANILTPSIRANFPVRVSFRIHLPNESKLVTGSNVATMLLPNGDAVLSENGLMTRFQSSKCDSEDIQPLIDECSRICQFDIPYTLHYRESTIAFSQPTTRDSLFEEAGQFCIDSGTASVSALQRRYSIGYTRAGKIMDELEAAGVVGPASGSNPRSVLMDSLSFQRLLECL